MIIPVSHEDMRGRRWPYVTIGIIALNVLIFLVSMGPMERGELQYQEKAAEALRYYANHAYLTPRPPIDSQVQHLSRHDRLMYDAIGAMKEAGREGRGENEEANKTEEQAELDALCQAALEAKNTSPLRKWAYVPAQNNFAGLITSQFLHAGWLHLIFNMLFLWLCGCNMEDRWGRVIFPLFYLSSGIVAGMAHKLASPHSTVPTVGASGAIAGCMGAFLICFATTRIRFLMILFLRIRFFTAPAYLMLPLWFITQLFWGSMTLGSEGGGVAFWAHIGGFVFGVVFAIGMKKSGMEQKVEQTIESQLSLEQAPDIAQAQELMEHGNTAEAIEVLEKFARREPSNIEAQLELLRAAKAAADGDRERRTYNRLIGLYLMQNLPDTALDLYREAEQAGLDGDVTAPLRLRLARHIEKTGDADRAAQEYCNIYSNEKANATSFQALLAHAQLALKLAKKAEAIQLFTAAQNSTVPHLDSDTLIAHGLKQATMLPDSKVAAGR